MSSADRAPQVMLDTMKLAPGKRGPVGLMPRTNYSQVNAQVPTTVNAQLGPVDSDSEEKTAMTTSIPQLSELLSSALASPGSLRDTTASVFSKLAEENCPPGEESSSDKEKKGKKNSDEKTAAQEALEYNDVLLCIADDFEKAASLDETPVPKGNTTVHELPVHLQDNKIQPGTTGKATTATSVPRGQKEAPQVTGGVPVRTTEGTSLSQQAGDADQKTAIAHISSLYKAAASKGQAPIAAIRTVHKLANAAPTQSDTAHMVGALIDAAKPHVMSGVAKAKDAVTPLVRGGLEEVGGVIGAGARGVRRGVQGRAAQAGQRLGNEMVDRGASAADALVDRLRGGLSNLVSPSAAAPAAAAAAAPAASSALDPKTLALLGGGAVGGAGLAHLMSGSDKMATYNGAPVGLLRKVATTLGAGGFGKDLHLSTDGVVEPDKVTGGNTPGRTDITQQSPPSNSAAADVAKADGIAPGKGQTYTKDDGRSVPRAELKAPIKEPALSAASDKVLPEAFEHASSSGAKVASDRALEEARGFLTGLLQRIEG